MDNAGLDDSGFRSVKQKSAVTGAFSLGQLAAMLCVRVWRDVALT